MYCFNPKHFEIGTFGFKKTEKYRALFLIESVQNLKENLAKQNITLLTYFQSPENILYKVCDKYLIDTIYTQKEWTTEEQQTTKLIKKTLDKLSFIENYDQFLYHPTTVCRDFSNIPEVFTRFRKEIEKKVTVQAEKLNPKLPKENVLKNSTTIPSLTDLGFENFEKDQKTAFPFCGGESTALKRIQEYFFETKKVSYYKKTRNGLLGTDYSTKLSPWLANGSISAKTIYWELKKYEKEYGANQSTYWVIFELIWRDYFKYISLKHQNKIFKITGILEKNYSWNRDKKVIKNWIEGTTKDDFVNANMKELKKTGWMSNRGRQNVASYFAKDLQLDWRIGAAYFESMLLDYDVHSNYGNWMYVSGVGNDPRDRKFNTKLQAERYDGNFKYRKLWLENNLF